MALPKTNRDFVRECVVTEDKHITGCCFYASVPGDPSVSRAYTAKSLITGLDLKRNNFMAVSSFNPPDDSMIPDGLKRKEQFFAEMLCIVIDDVGTKLTDAFVHHHLGRPTWIIETSPGNYQYGYRLSRPITDLGTAKGVSQAMSDLFTGDMAGVNRLFRLPYGINGKAKYGTPSPETRLIEVTPDRELDVDVLIAKFRVRRTPAKPKEPFLPLEDDPIIQAMELDEHSWMETSTPGTYEVQCPWVDKHTDGRDDGAAYLAPAGFRCHHGHCDDKTFKDFREHFGVSAAEVDAAMTDAAIREEMEVVAPAPAHPTRIVLRKSSTPPLKSSTATSSSSTTKPPSASPTPTSSPSASSSLADALTTPPVKPPKSTKSILDDSSVKRFHQDGSRVMTRSEVQTHFPRQWIFEDLVTANGAFMIAGSGGLGKSRLALAISMAAATGLPWGPFVPKDTLGIRTMMLTQEDDDSEKAHRYTTQLRWMQKKDPRWEAPYAIERLERNLYLPEIDPTEGLSRKLLLALKQEQLTGGPFQFMVWDPLILFWQGEDDQGLNSASGARETINALAAVNRGPCKSAGLSYGTCIVHHLNKSGSVMGSVMVENLTRTVFKLDNDDGFTPSGTTKRGILRIDKANGISKAGAEVPMYLETKDAVVDFRAADFDMLSREDRVVRALATATGLWHEDDGTIATTLSKSMLTLADTVTERKRLISEVLKSWGDYTAEQLEEIGIELQVKGKKRRYAPKGDE